MARLLFGGSSDDYVVDSSGKPVTNRRVRFYTTALATTEITDLASDAAGTGAPLAVLSNTAGFWGPVYGPDGVSVMYAGAVDASGNPPTYVVAVYTHTQVGAVASVNGHTGTVVLAAADVGADAAGAATTAQSASLQKSANLTDVASVSAARTALGLGTAATQAATAFDTAGAAATVQTNLTAEVARAQNAEAAITNGLKNTQAAVVATTNQALTGLPTVDGVTLTAGQVILLVGQSSGSQNGLWSVASGAWSRPAFFAVGSDATGTNCWVESGTANASSSWVVTGTTNNVVGTNVLTWQQASGLGEVTVTSDLTKTGNQLGLATTAVTPATYTAATVTIDAKGRITAASNGAYTSVRGERIRRASLAALGRNSLELGVMATPPTVTASTSTNDATLTKTYRFPATQSNFAYRGGLPTIVFVSQVRMPVVTTGTGGTGGNAVGSKSAYGFATEFYTDAPKVEILLSTAGADGAMFEVNGAQVSASVTATPSNVGGPYYYLLDFTSAGGAAIRHIRAEGHLTCAFAGANVGPTYRVWAPSDTNLLKVACIGDSVVQGTGGLLNRSFTMQLGKMLGWDTYPIGVGGSGYVQVGSFNTYGDALRVADAVAVNPDIVFIPSSVNDIGQAGVQAAALACFQAYRAALPSAPIIVGGVYPGTTGPSAAATTTESQVLAAFTAWADSNSFYIPVTSDATGAWISGTGKVGTTNGSGNSDIYVSSDGTHPSPAGHDYLAQRYARAIRALVLPTVT